MTAPTKFSEVAAALHGAGYSPLPIKRGDKRPSCGDGWQHYAFDADDIERYANDGCGVLCGTLAAVDIDVYEPELAAAIERMVYEVCGVDVPVPRRIGQPPKVLIPFRVGGGEFAKMQTKKYKLRSVPDAPKESGVEILARGQQFVAYAVHPDTHEPYEWNGGGDLLRVPVGLLPELTQAQAQEIKRRAETLLVAMAEPVVPTHANGPPDATTVAAGGRNDMLTRFAGKLRHAGLDESEILGALLARNSARCTPPLDESEVHTIARSVARYDPAPTTVGVVNILRRFAAPPFSDRDAPPTLAAYARTLARAAGGDPSWLLVAATVALAGVIPDTIRLQCRRTSHWYESARLWALGVGAPGSWKSPAVRAVTRRIFAAHRELVARFAAENATATEGGNTTRADAPPRPALIASDATIEKLSEILHDNPSGILLVNDEFESWFAALDARRSGAAPSRDRGEWLRLFDGGYHTIDRIKRGSYFVKNWGVSLLSATTPATLQANSRNLPNDGLLARFIVVAVAPMQRPDTTMMQAECDAAGDEYTKLLDAAIDLRDTEITVRMTGYARARFEAAGDALRDMVNTVAESDARFSAHLAKHHALLARVALVFHFVATGGRLIDGERVIDLSDETMRLAERFMRRAFQHSYSVYADMGGASVHDHARRVARSLLADNEIRYNRRNLSHKSRAFRDLDPRERSAVLSLLQDFGWLDPEIERNERGEEEATGAWTLAPGVRERFAAEREAALRARAEMVARITAGGAED